MMGFLQYEGIIINMDEVAYVAWVKAGCNSDDYVEIKFKNDKKLRKFEDNDRKLYKEINTTCQNEECKKDPWVLVTMANWDKT